MLTRAAEVEPGTARKRLKKRRDVVFKASSKRGITQEVYLECWSGQVKLTGKFPPVNVKADPDHNSEYFFPPPDKHTSMSTEKKKT